MINVSGRKALIAAAMTFAVGLLPIVQNRAFAFDLKKAAADSARLKACLGELDKARQMVEMELAYPWNAHKDDPIRGSGWDGWVAAAKGVHVARQKARQKAIQCRKIFDDVLKDLEE